jgi:HAD superfamily hydrolase (TIGR01509 family)
MMAAAMRDQPAVLFDLDGTLVDSVYHHVLALRRALFDQGFDLSAWRIHRRVGMSGGLLVHALGRELGHQFQESQVQEVQAAHARYFRELEEGVRPLPGASHLLQELSRRRVLVAVATSGTRQTAGASLRKLGLGPEVPVVTRDEVPFAKPDPDLFLAAAERVGAPVASCIVVGDSVWDILTARRAGALGVGVLSGGYSRQELEVAGAFRVYQDAAALEERLDELGIRM